MPYPFLRPIAYRVRGLQTPILRRTVLRPSSRPMSITTASTLVLAPHPDDETFGCGGLIAMKRARGGIVSIAILTDGGQSLARPEADAGQLVRDRKIEALAATAVLGVPSDHVHFLNGPDGALGALTGEARSGFVSRLRDLIISSGAAEMYVPHRYDRHPDHEAAYCLAMEALASSLASANALPPILLEYMVWLVWKRPLLRLSLDELRGAARLDVTEAQPVKDRAIEVYRSQLATMPPGFLPQFRGGEEYFWTANASAEVESSLTRASER